MDLIIQSVFRYVFQINRRFKLNMFHMITGINNSKTLTNHISCECKFKFDGRKCNSNQWWDNTKCQ